MSEHTTTPGPSDQEPIDPDGDPELRNPRDDRDDDLEAAGDPDTDPDSLNPRDDRPT